MANKQKEEKDALRKTMLKTIAQIDGKEQLEEGSKKVSEDLEDAIEENTDFSEETEGSIAPIEKSGSSEIEHSEDMKKRFCKKHEIDEQALRDNAKETDTTPSGS